MKDAAEPEGLVEFLRQSPLTKAVADGEISPDVFERERESSRDIDLSEIDPGKPNDATS
ncbi:MAG TPA: hypothetical protein VN706_05380 [Gemmatimonadaceae bacterium]|nr:hypothetical protein [Gemmatimonadaceae bacterium]